MRELTQSTHAVICKAAGRNLAPYLKQLMPHWYLAQFDIYSPVASASRKGFQTVFPNEKKQTEVIKFCISEVIANLSNNLDTVFRIRKSETHHKSKKKQGNKKEGGNDKGGQENSSVHEDQREEPEVGVTSKVVDSENYEIRMSFATLQCISQLIVLEFTNEEFLDFVFGTDGVFWGGAECTKDIMVIFTSMEYDPKYKL